MRMCIHRKNPTGTLLHWLRTILPRFFSPDSEYPQMLTLVVSDYKQGIFLVIFYCGQYWVQCYLWVLDDETVTIPLAAHMNKSHTCIYGHSHLTMIAVKADDSYVHHLSLFNTFFFHHCSSKRILGRKETWHLLSPLEVTPISYTPTVLWQQCLLNE